MPRHCPSPGDLGSRIFEVGGAQKRRLSTSRAAKATVCPSHMVPGGSACSRLAEWAAARPPLCLGRRGGVRAGAGVGVLAGGCSPVGLKVGILRLTQGGGRNGSSVAHRGFGLDEQRGGGKAHSCNCIQNFNSGFWILRTRRAVLFQEQLGLKIYEGEISRRHLASRSVSHFRFCCFFNISLHAFQN